MAFGVMSKEMQAMFGTGLVNVLIANCVAKGKPNDDAETRR